MGSGNRPYLSGYVSCSAGSPAHIIATPTPGLLTNLLDIVPHMAPISISSSLIVSNGGDLLLVPGVVPVLID
jgi:hypothetical protein